MDLTEWIISLALILVVLRQVRGRKLTLIGSLWPVPLVAWGAFKYLGGIPGYPADWWFVAACCITGLLLGIGCALLTEVYAEGGVVKARARWLAAVLWVAGMGSRLAFGLFATSGGGSSRVAELSAKLGVHSANTWASALIVMALVEVIARSTLLFLRYRRLRPAEPHAEKTPDALAAS